MFNKKNDPLIDSVRAVMEQNEMFRQIEQELLEEYGVTSRQALPHEILPEFDAVLAEAKKCAMEELADKDYDKDGKIESPKDEVWGSRLRAAKKAGKIEEESDDEKGKKEEKKEPLPFNLTGDKIKRIPSKVKGLRHYVFTPMKMEEESDQLDEGPFQGIGRMRMKAGLKKDIEQHSAEMDKELSTRGSEDEWAKSYDERERKKKVLSRLRKEESEQLDEVSKKTAISAYAQSAAAAKNPTRRFDDSPRDKDKQAKNIRRMIEKKHGKKVAKDADQAAEIEDKGRYPRSKGLGYDPLETKMNNIPKVKPSKKTGKLSAKDTERLKGYFRNFQKEESDQLDERKMTSAEKEKEAKIKKKVDPSGMKASMKKQYGPEKGKNVYFATIRKQAMSEESLFEEIRNNLEEELASRKRPGREEVILTHHPEHGYDVVGTSGGTYNKLYNKLKTVKSHKEAKNLFHSHMNDLEDEDEKNNMNENIDSIMEEIRNNLEEELAYVYENYDEETFNDYVNSLSEEQLEILDLTEAISGDKTRQQQGAALVGNKGPAGGLYQGGGINNDKRRNVSPAGPVRPGGGQSAAPGSASKPGMPGTQSGPTPAKSAAKPSAPKPGAPGSAPGSKSPGAGRAARPAQRPAAPARRFGFDTGRRGNPGMGTAGRNMSAGQTMNRALGGVYEETETPSQIKESFESFLRNKFLKD